jgi:hypothetical protein
MKPNLIANLRLSLSALLSFVCFESLPLESEKRVKASDFRQESRAKGNARETHVDDLKLALSALSVCPQEATTSRRVINGRRCSPATRVARRTRRLSAGVRWAWPIGPPEPDVFGDTEGRWAEYLARSRFTR